ncbi:hypothetical protein D6829_00195 [Candidatus Pacearchaeota archaeon]|nr:MAG: hypothetical protein D6829_00195 [Candidatus Pacearchaeota archaeon]
MVSTEDILKKYSVKIEQKVRGYRASPDFSRSYRQFKADMVRPFSRYERWCKTFGGVFHMNVGEKDAKRIGRAIEIAHLDLTVSEVMVFSTIVLLSSLFGGVLFIVGIYLLTGAFSFIFPILVLLFSIFLFYYTAKIPERLAVLWRLKASSQMVPAILYIVVYMKHTSNFEKAVAFAAEHLEPPLSLDFRKVFWDVEVGKFSTIKESIDHYLEGWRDYSTEFLEAFHLIESSLFEPSEDRRVIVLERALKVILEGVYDKMLKYTHDVKAPLTNVYMLGIVLPTLALAILPLASTMLSGAIRWYHVLIIFDVMVPFLVLYLTDNIMMERPGGHGETSLLEKNPLYPKYKSRKHYVKGALFAFPFFVIGIIPLLWRYTGISNLLGMKIDYTWKELGFGFLGDVGVFGIERVGDSLVGPFGMLSLILSLFVPLSIALMFIVAYRSKTAELLKAREDYKGLEKEFTSSLFQLGNRLGDGLPAEIAFSKVSESVKGTKTEGFFRLVNENIQRLGMSLEAALFDPRRGAVIFYPSHLVSTSMRILVESVKKGLRVAARSLMSISEYVKNIKKIEGRLNDLLADIISDMKSNMGFLAPLLSGIIVGLSGMITLILTTLSAMFNSGKFSAGGEVFGGGSIKGILSIFNVTEMIPTYWLQVVVGIYLIEIVFILTSALVTIRSGRDKLAETAEVGKNLQRTILLYFVIATFSIIGLTLIGVVALSGIAA